VSAANVIRACLMPKLRTANTFKFFFIIPLKNMTTHPFFYQSNIRATHCPDRCKIVTAEGHTWYFRAFFRHRPWPPQLKKDLFWQAHHRRCLRKRAKKGLPGRLSSSWPQIFYTGGQCTKFMNNIVMLNFSKIAPFCEIIPKILTKSAVHI
jgi:hypothetical protein